MRMLVILPLAAALLGAAGAAFADMDMLKKYNCMACHAVDRKVFGPSLKSVAAKYGADAGAPDALVKRVRAGGSGVWGDAPMPPQPQVSEADAKTLVAYILTLD